LCGPRRLPVAPSRLSLRPPDGSISFRRLGPQHQRQDRLGSEPAGEEAQRPYSEGQARLLRLDTGFAQQARPVLGMTFFRRRELQEHAATFVVRVVGKPAKQRATGDLVGVHLLQAFQPFGGRRFLLGLRHDVTVSIRAPVNIMREAVLQ
jgi:hypothetical protein